MTLEKEEIMLSKILKRLSLRDVIKDERGDVPGWILITLMTAALTMVIWALAGPALGDLFQSAIDRVTGM